MGNNELDDKKLKTEQIFAKARAEIPTQNSTEEINHTIQFVEDLALELEAEISRVEVSLEEMISWKEGEVVKFPKVIGEPVDLILADKTIARGEIVVVNERYGVKINEIVRTEEKVNQWK